jgi:glutathione S-transferase
MKLYYAPGTCALACWISLEWAKADYQVEKVDMHSEAYKKINPLAQVPALDIGGPRPMMEAGAILNYIAEKYPEANLGADNGLENRFLFNEALSFLTGDFHPAFWPFFAPQRFTTQTDKQALESVRAASHARVDRVMVHLDQTIGGRNHVYKDKRSVADAYAFVMASWTTNFPKTWQAYPNVARVMESVKADPTVQRVLELSKK